MKVKDLIKQLENMDPDGEIDGDADVDIGDLSNESFDGQMGVLSPDDSKPVRGKKARLIFFYEKPHDQMVEATLENGLIVQLDERQAYSAQYESSPQWKQLGCSDGRTFYALMKDPAKKLRDAEMIVLRKESRKLAVPNEDYVALDDARDAFEKAKNDALVAEFEKAKGHLRRPPNNQWIGTSKAVKVAKGRLGIGIQE